MTTKFGELVHIEELTQMRLIRQLVMTSPLQHHVTNQKPYNSTKNAPRAIKLGRMVTYVDRLQPKKSHDPLISRSCND